MQRPATAGGGVPAPPRDEARSGEPSQAPVTSEGLRQRRSLSTGHRLSLVFATLICSFVVILLFAFSGLRNIERALDRMHGHEEQMRLSLELGKAVRGQYTHQAQVAAGESAHLADYREARRRVVELEQQLLEAHVHDAAAVGWIKDIARGSDELDAILRERAQPAILRTLDEGYPLVSMMEERLDRLFARQRDATVEVRGQVSQLQRSTLRWVICFLLGAPLLATALGLYVRHSVTKPVARLGEGAARLAQGDLDTRIDIGTHDEFGALASQFNGMTAAIKQHQEQLVQSEKLASVGRLAARVAHELNNPLSVILGYLMIHRREATGRLARDLGVIEQEAVRCKDIVQDLLELSRPASLTGCVPVNVRQLCDEVVAALSESGQLTGCRVSVLGAGTATANRHKLSQIVVNLLRNAAEAAGDAGWVRVEVAESSAGLEVAVSDSGPGVSAAVRSRIFEPFFTTKPMGTGLGLAVSRAIARAHGGDLVLGQGEAGGRFTLRLPAGAERRV